MRYRAFKRKKVKERVSTISLDSIISDFGLSTIDLLKIDCEGCEYLIFRTLRKENFERIKKIVMEFHEFSDDQHHRELKSILEHNGFKTEIKKNFFEHTFMGFGKIIAWK